MADARLPALPWASRLAVAHPPTGRVVRRKLISQALFLLLVWPGLIAGSILLGVDDHRFIPLMGRILIAALIVVPVNAWGAVSALRMYRVLSEHAWRLVECDVVAPVSHAWRLKEYETPTGRGVRVPAILRINGEVFMPTPFKRRVNAGLSHVWCAGPPRPGAVVSEPGGARPFRLARYTGPGAAG